MDDRHTGQLLVARFWEAALGFWRKGGARSAWPLTLAVIAIALLNIVLQYRVNVWHRAMFDALDKRDGRGVLYQSLIFLPLTLTSIGIAAGATYAKLTTQRNWRDWLNAHVLDRWLAGGRYYQLNLVPGDHANPEYRVAEDLRIACEAPVEFAIGLDNPVLESKKRQLYSLVRTYLAQIAVNTWPTRDGRQTVPPEWETEQPERFIETVERLHTLAGGIVEAHQNLVRAARERLKV